MEAKKKAQHLIDFFKPFMYCYVGSGMLTDDYDEKTANGFAKKAALKVASETINELSDLPRIPYNERREHYWNEVKQELEKL